MGPIETATRYREEARAKLASAFGWENDFDVASLEPDAVGYVEVSIGAPIGDTTVLYSSGVGWPAYRGGTSHGTEFVVASSAGELAAAKLLLGFSATVLVKSLAPQVGGFSRDFRARCSLEPGAARNALLTPAMVWGEAANELYVGDFWLVPLHIALVTDDELEFFLANGWDDFSRWMGEAHVDVTRWDRAV